MGEWMDGWVSGWMDDYTCINVYSYQFKFCPVENGGGQ